MVRTFLRTHLGIIEDQAKSVLVKAAHLMFGNKMYVEEQNKIRGKLHFSFFSGKVENFTEYCMCV